MPCGWLLQYTTPSEVNDKHTRSVNNEQQTSADTHLLREG
jgi:hypothetical protein